MRQSIFFFYTILFTSKGAEVQWSAWSDCSETCQPGPNLIPLQIRNKNCQPNECNGPTLQSQSCNVQVGCPGTWGIWQSWSGCSATCQMTSDPPQKSRVRVCSGGTFDKKCDGKTEVDKQACNTVYCEGKILEWSSWNLCPEMCSVALTALRTRTRACIGYSTWDSNFFGCTGFAKSEEQQCYGQVPCKGTYNEWERWNSCSESCQSNSNKSPSQYRVRLCVGDNLAGGCIGTNQETRNCNEQVPCPGTWGTWTAWNQCSATCQMTIDQPKMFRYRVCSGGTFSKSCDGQKEIDSQACNTVRCEGQILEWSAWNLCPEMCSAASTALRKRTRACVGYSTWDSNFFGCTGFTKSEEEPCYGKLPCKGTYGEWQQWGVCSETCQSNLKNSPSQYRTKFCIGDNLGGGCSGNGQESRICNSMISCPGKVTEWGTWSECYKDCATIGSMSLRTRKRSCVLYTFGGNCNGNPLQEYESCSESFICAGDIFEWEGWQSWLEWNCIVSKQGISLVCKCSRDRIRSCPIGLCNGDSSESDSCSGKINGDICSCSGSSKTVRIDVTVNDVLSHGEKIFGCWYLFLSSQLCMLIYLKYS